MLVLVLQMFSMYEVARLQRLVCREFRDAGQERIHERGGRTLYEEFMAFMFGYDHYIIDQPRARLLFQASCDADCKTALVQRRMFSQNISDEEKQKILKDLKEIGTTTTSTTSIHNPGTVSTPPETIPSETIPSETIPLETKPVVSERQVMVDTNGDGNLDSIFEIYSLCLFFSLKNR